MKGRLIGIARTMELRATMEVLEQALVSIDSGIELDARGRKPKRQITILFREGWEDACAELSFSLPWTMRRANLYVEGMAPPREAGGMIAIGDVLLSVELETRPCMLMEASHRGLKRALTPEWRGGVCCSVIRGGRIAMGDAVSIATHS